ncbi:MAG: Rieske 2Fe-2S domain-containing protein [Actinomycetota bacterium]
MPLLSQTLERLVAAVETNTSLDAPADRLAKLTGAIPAGPLKDTLSGTEVGHPLHPVLVTVPIGSVASAIVLDLTGGDRDASRRLIGLGILSSLPAAATGLSDWSDTEGAERRVGLVHAASNTVGLALLTASWLSRRGGGGGRLLALAGFGVMGAGGWLGGHLSYALGVGVDTTAFMSPPTDWTDVCADTDLLEGQPQSFTVRDMPVLLVRNEGRVRALGDRCTHRGAPLHEGPIVDGCIECPWHASRFSLDDGAVVRGPATRPQPAFEVQVSGGRVRVRRAEERALRLNPAS